MSVLLAKNILSKVGFGYGAGKNGIVNTVNNNPDVRNVVEKASASTVNDDLTVRNVAVNDFASMEE